MIFNRSTARNDGNKIVIGHWLYDEKPEPELAKKDAWRKKRPARPLAKEGDPVVIDRELLKSGHTIVRGKTGSGKTSRGLLPLALALMEEYVLEWEEVDQ